MIPKSTIQAHADSHQRLPFRSPGRNVSMEEKALRAIHRLASDYSGHGLFRPVVK